MTEDEDLRSRLRRADPAASLAPLAPDEASRLLEETMTTTITPAPPRATDHRPRRRYAVLVAAAFVLIAAAGAGWLLTRPAAPVIDAAKPVVVSLTTNDIRAKCVAPTAQILATSTDFAAAGTVTGIADDMVTLRVTHVYKGTKAGEVRVGQAPGSSEQMLGSGQFELGKKYLVASSAGNVLTCGYSGEADSIGLQDLYNQAF